MSVITVKLDSFEGPFDLLFHLIEKNKIDIYDIPITKLTDQYIEYINNFENRNMDSMSEFVLMAATLIEIKSKLLLPKHKEENSEEEEDPRESLVKRLIEYKKFKKIAEILDERQENAGLEVFKEPEKSVLESVKPKKENDINELLDGVTLDMLFRALEDVLKRKEIKTDKVRSNFDSVKKDLFTIEDKIQYIDDLIKLNKSVKFSKIFRKNSTKSEIVVTFLAMLEMIKIKRIFVSQKNIFDDIIITAFDS